MKVRELKRIIDSLSEEDLEREVAVKIHGIYATEPRVLIKDAYPGFDWSHGIFMLVPAKELKVHERKFKKVNQMLEGNK